MNQVNEHTIHTWLDAHKEEMIAVLKDWVSIPSVSRAELAAPGAPYGPDCRRMLDRALSTAEAFGFHTEDHAGYCGSVVFGSGEKEIGIAAHLDVVPQGEGWLWEPYRPTVVGDFLIGRGVKDNKSAAVMALFLMRFFRDHDIRLHSSLRLMMGCAEETGMADFKHYTEVQKAPVPWVTLVADCGFPVCYAQKGGFDATFALPCGEHIVDFQAGLVRNSVPDLAVVTLRGIDFELAKRAIEGHEKVTLEADGEESRLIARGKAGHAAYQVHGEKNNAIVIAADALCDIQKACNIALPAAAFISQCFSTAFGDGFDIQCQDEASGELTINAGVIGRVGAELQLDIDIRYPVSAEAENIAEKLAAAANRYGAALRDVNVSRPFYIDPQDPIVCALQQTYYELTGDDRKPYAMGGGTYSRVIPRGISFGPGLPVGGHKPDFMPQGHGMAHGRDEALSLEDWFTGFRIYLNAILRLDALAGGK